MTAQHDDGGPAFPTGLGDEKWILGMTLRDWFAGQYLCGLMAGDGGGLVSEVAVKAYHVADALIAEKRRREGGGA